MGSTSCTDCSVGSYASTEGPATRGWTRPQGMVSMSMELESEVLILISDWKLGYGHAHTHICIYIYIHVNMYIEYIYIYPLQKIWVSKISKDLCGLKAGWDVPGAAREVSVHWLQGWVLPTCCGFHQLPPMWIRPGDSEALCCAQILIQGRPCWHHLGLHEAVAAIQAMLLHLALILGRMGNSHKP